MKLLITHEFTHVVHLDTMLSPARSSINSLLGRTFAPNLAQPTWFIEGMAVLMESRQTTAGRLRSSFYDMHLRVPFLEGRLFGLDAVSSIPSAYPQGTAAYLYGSSLLRYIEDRYGPQKIREISHRYADTCIPGGINRTAEQAVGRRLRRGLRRRPLGRLAPLDRPPLRAADRGGGAAGRSRPRRASPGTRPRRAARGPARASSPDGTLVYQRRTTISRRRTSGSTPPRARSRS